MKGNGRPGHAWDCTSNLRTGYCGCVYTNTYPNTDENGYKIVPREEALVVGRMKAWAEAHPEADTQGLDDGDWEALARAALGLA